MSFRSACARNGPPAGLQAQLNSTFILANLQMCKVQRQSPNTKSIHESGWIGGGRRLGFAGSGGSCARRSLRGGGSPSRLWWWVYSLSRHFRRVGRTRFRMCWTSWCQIMVPEMPGATLEITTLHCQRFRQPLVETCPSVDCKTQDKDWKTNKQLGCARTNLQPMQNLGEWRATAMQTDLWLTHMDSSIQISTPK